MISVLSICRYVSRRVLYCYAKTKHGLGHAEAVYILLAEKMKTFIKNLLFNIDLLFTVCLRLFGNVANLEC